MNADTLKDKPSVSCTFSHVVIVLRHRVYSRVKDGRQIAVPPQQMSDILRAPWQGRTNS